MMRVAIGGFGAESNAFSVESPVRTVEDLLLGEDLIQKHLGRRTVIGGFLDALADAEVKVIPTLRVWWGATGVIAEESYEHLKSDILKLVRKAGRLDGLLLDLHGAMVAEGTPDAEGQLLSDFRTELGESAAIVAVLDIHGNISDLKVKSADALLGYRTNPHVDLYERGLKAGRLLLGILKREIEPVMALRRLPMLGPNLGMSTWTYSSGEEGRLPFARIMRRVSEMEKHRGIIDISVFIGFPYSDVPECVTSVLVTADGDLDLAEEKAEEVSQVIWDSRREFLEVRQLVPVDEAVEMAMEAPRGPVILVDVGDNSGGGGPCDGTVILEALLRKGAQDAVVAIRDPWAVEEAFSSGVGSTIEVEVGGKIDGRFYKPVKVKARVRTLFEGRYIIRGPHHGGHMTRNDVLPKEAWREADVGRTAVLEVDGVEIIISEGRVGMEQDYYKAAGIDPAQRRIVAVKSHQAHRASFERIAYRIIEVDTPGSTSPGYKGLKFKNVPRPVFPLDPV
jgi:microcystin degradation protein MlrC